MKRFCTFLKTELKLSLRDMNMPIFAVIMPLVIFVILGVIYGRKPAFGGADYTFLEQSFGVVGAVAICAGGLMGLPQAVSSLRELRVFKRFRVTPVSPVFVLGVELAMYIVYCIVSLATLAAAALLWGVRLRGSLLAFLGSWALTTRSTLSVGMLVGGVAKDVKQAGVIASILYFPMLIFSGATLPIEVMPPVMRKIVSFFPLTQGLTMMKNAFLGVSTGNILLPVFVMLGLTVLCTALAIFFSAGSSASDITILFPFCAACMDAEPMPRKPTGFTGIGSFFVKT